LNHTKKKEETIPTFEAQIYHQHHCSHKNVATAAITHFASCIPLKAMFWSMTSGIFFYKKNQKFILGKRRGQFSNLPFHSKVQIIIITIGKYFVILLVLIFFSPWVLLCYQQQVGC